jgi:hypothetical protein
LIAKEAKEETSVSGREKIEKEFFSPSFFSIRDSHLKHFSLSQTWKKVYALNFRFRETQEIRNF